MRNCHPVWLALSVMLAAAAAGEQPAPEKALDQILANTGLRYEYLDARTVAVLSSQTAVTPSLIARDRHPTKVVTKERGGPPSTASVHTQNESATPTQRPPPRERTAPRENRGDRGTQK